MSSEAPAVAIPVQPMPFRHGMPRLAGRLAGVGSIKVATLGSSTFAGEGGIVPMPQRLETALRAYYPGRNFDVLNRGVGGEEAPDEVRRMQRDVIDERPAVVIWQVGTNAAWKKQDLDAVARAIRQGIAMLADAFVDIVLMDPQYVPQLLLPDKIAGTIRMVRLIEEAAAGAADAGVPVNIFKRFDLMRNQREVERISFDRVLDPGDFDRVHHSDWSVNRTAWLLADCMANAVKATPPAAAA
jgi:GDSL-like lipase/acylhydrolase family protein